MKTLSLALIFIFFQLGVMKAQTDKPRFLKLPTLISPIDITKSYSEKGLFKGNPGTILIKKTSIVEAMEDTAKRNVIVNKYRVDTVLLKGIQIERNYAFNIIMQVGSFSIIKFWDSRLATSKSLIKKFQFREQPVKGLRKLSIEDDYQQWEIKDLIAKVKGDSIGIDLSQSYYILPTSILIKNSTEFENKANTWNIGILALPVKIRPFATERGQFDFSNGYSVGTTFSWTVQHHWTANFTHNFLLYAGLSSYTADSVKIKESRKDYKISTFSPAIGWMWERNKVQLSVLMGVDFPSGVVQKQWVYRNRPWFGIGLGISLFKIDNETSTTIGKN